MRGKQLTFTLCTIAAIAAAFGVWGHRLTSAKPNPELPPNKKVHLLVMYLSDIPPDLRVEVEEAIGSKTVAPELKARGYVIGNVYSMTKITIGNGGPYRALIEAMKSEPDADEARLLTVTIVARPGTYPGTIVTEMALLDTHVWDLETAHELHMSAHTEVLWSYEDTPTELYPDDAIIVLKERLRRGIGIYDEQFSERPKTEYREGMVE